MFDFLCWIFTFLAGGLIGWLLAGWLAQRDCEESKGDKVVEKRVDNPEHLALINKLQTENKEISVLKTKLSGYESTKANKVDNPAHLKKISDLETKVKDLEAAAKTSTTSSIPKNSEKSKATTKNDRVSTVDKNIAKSSGFRLKNLGGKDDFTVVLGIGPKISGLIHDTDKHTFKELSETSVEDIQKVLDNAGPRFKLAVPETWPAQAKLAAENKWEELKAWQDELDGGKLT